MNKTGITYKKLLLLGDRGAGKSCFIKKMQNDNYIPEYSRTDCHFFI